MRQFSIPALVCCLVLTCSCVGVNVRRVPNQVVNVTGKSTSPQLASLQAQQTTVAVATPTASWGAWANRELTATATVPPPSFSPGDETQRLFSRRQAISDAQRSLAAQIEQMRTPDGRAVADYAANDSVGMQIENLIQTESRIVEEAAQPSGSYYIRMNLRTDSLTNILSGASVGTPADQALQAQRQQAQAQVQMEAERDARQKLLQSVSASLSNKPGVTIGEKMQEDEGFRQHVMTLIQQAPVQNTRFSQNGTCEVDMSLELDQIRSKS